MSRPRAALRWIAWLLVACATLAALASSAFFIEAARLPYNQGGRHFADGVVQHAQAVPVYAGLALVFFGLAAVFAWLAVRIGRRCGQVQAVRPAK